ncbi:HNH endonuclease [Motiliproteus sp. SC1-56]|uniref:HNH endonuclease n=1 Tax=Motiliproteus sp. SC1-56 TaxID=2799565 RepID=UPI001A8C5BA0|nr:hypothetical protein [Motiliproteus sp. SC1-56]
MINQKHDVAAPSKRVHKVFKSKSQPRKRILESLIDRVNNRIVAFVTRRKFLHEIGRELFSNPEKDALEHCYDGETSELNRIKHDLIKSLENQDKIYLSKCPYCLMREPETWDHYLPKSKFPEFSVYSPNLIWVCNKCNQKKSDGLVENVKEVIHTYFDKLPEDCRLVCRINIDEDHIPNADFYINNYDSSDCAELLERHFLAFELRDLYIKESGSYISSIIKEFSLRYPGGISALQLEDELMAKYQSIPASWGKNHWQAAVLKGLNECEGLADLINSTASEQLRGWIRN